MSYDVLVIGGGPAGLSASINVRARGRSALVVSNPLEENPLWRAEKVDNYLGLPGLSGAEMLAAMRRHAEQAGVEFLAGKVLNAVQMPDAWYVSVGPDMYNARAVVLAAGVARGKKFAGEAELLGRGVSYCATCDGMLYRGKPVAVVGYTDTARQEAEFLQKIGCSVTYFDRPKQCEIRGDGRVESVTCDGRTIPAEGVFILRPTMAPTELPMDSRRKSDFLLYCISSHVIRRINPSERPQIRYTSHSLPVTVSLCRYEVAMIELMYCRMKLTASFDPVK